MMVASWWGNVKVINLLGYTEVGFITVLMQLQIVISFVPNILNSIMLPKLSNLFAIDKMIFFKRFRLFVVIVLSIAFVGSAIFYIFSKQILLLYSSNYASLYKVFQLFCISYVLNIAISLINQLILSSDNIWWTFIINFSWVLPFVLLLEPKVKQNGLTGYAFVYNISYAIQFLVSLFYLIIYFNKHKSYI
jgi:O-antigen/teichoic acid export membrane protein